MVNHFLNKLLDVVLVFILLCGQAWGAGVASGVAGKYGFPTKPRLSIDPYTMVVIPDTQIHTFSPVWLPGFLDQTSWIRENVSQQNIVFVTHLGDVVQGSLGGLEVLPTLGWADQLLRGHAAIDQLDAINLLDGRVLPYSVSMGNHDLLPRGDKLNPADSVPGGGFRTYFGAARYASYRIGEANPFQWYGGSDATQWNHYQIFEAGPYTYLHLNLELEPQDPTNDLGIPRIVGVNDALAWAQSVIDANPGLPTIISTHKLLTDLQGVNNRVGYWGDGVDEFFGGERTSTAQVVWETLVKGNPQVFMTINGHEHEGPYREDGEYHQISTNDAGLAVFEILVNYQDYFNLLTGNDPYLRFIEFDPVAGQIRNKTFSPTFASFMANPDEIENTYVGILDAFELGMFIPILSGEELISAIAPFPLFPGDVPHTRDDAAAVLLDFFAVSSVEELRNVSFSPLLTDADSQFSFDVGFGPQGRPSLADVVPMDVQPFTCSDEFNIQRKSPFVVVALFGDSALLAQQIDPVSLRLKGVVAYEYHILFDVGAPPNTTTGDLDDLDCRNMRRDGYKDLLVFFNRAQLIEAMGDIETGQTEVLRLIGNLKTEFSGTPIVGEDEIRNKRGR